MAVSKKKVTETGTLAPVTLNDLSDFSSMVKFIIHLEPARYNPGRLTFVVCPWKIKGKGTRGGSVRRLQIEAIQDRDKTE